MTQSQLITIALILVVVARFLARELKARTARVTTLWIRPAFLIALTGLMSWLALSRGAGSAVELGASLAFGALLGVVVGVLVTGSTRIEASGRPGLVTLRGSWVTVAIWIAALMVRLGIRVAGGGYTAAASPALTAGTAAMAAVAFGAFALLVALRARKLALASRA